MSQGNILIVEDEVIVARSIENMLLNFGYTVTGILTTGEEAVQMVCDSPPDLIIMDIKLQGTMDGIEAAHKINSCCNVPMIFLTALGDSSTMHRAKGTEPYGYLYKPVKRKELITSIELALYKHGMESKLRESEARYRGLVENSPTGIIHVDTKGNIIDVNPKLLEILGSPSAEATRQINIFTFELLKKSGVSESFRKCLETGKPWTMEHPYTSKWGKTSYVRLHLNPVTGIDGTVIGVQANVEDYTERRKMEETLQKEKEFIDMVLDTQRDTFFVFDPITGKAIRWNREFRETTGYTDEEIASLKAPDTYFDPEDLKKASTETDRIKEEGHATLEMDLICKDGRKIPTEYSGSLIKDEEGKPKYIISIGRDIKERRKAEKEREELLTELEEKRRELQNLIYVASHDLRSPLVNVQGFSQEITKTMEEISSLIQVDSVPGEIRKKVEDLYKEDITEANRFIQTSIKKMDSLVYGLLRISRVGTVEIAIEPLVMNELIAKVRETFEYRLKDKDVTLIIQPLPDSMGDETQISQVFSNILDNAIKYLDPSRHGTIRVSGEEKDGKAIYRLEDNGVGIPKGEQEKIFEIFHRVNIDETAGEGLGLTTVRRILDRHNGRIWLESEQGKGSVFFISLPSVQ